MTERRTLWLFLALVVGQLSLIAAQLPDPTGERSVIESLAVRLVAPVGVVVDAAADWADGLVARLSTRSRLLEENRKLSRENRRLQREALDGFGLESDVRRLSEALTYSRARAGSVQVADVVYIDHASWLQSLLLRVSDGTVERNQPVVTVDGLVGRVIVATGGYAKVQLLTDRAASVGAMVERTRRQGLVRGAGGGRLTLEFIPLQAEIEVGDRLVTAGVDGIYPRGIPIGTVVSVVPGEELFFDIEVAPVVDFGRLDQAYLLASSPVPETLLEAARSEGR